jgi:hypothetical protein
MKTAKSHTSWLGATLVAATLVVAVPAAPVAAQSDGMMSRHSMDGKVTKVDAKRGWIDVKTAEGSMKLHFPPTALAGVKTGDSVTVELGMNTAMAPGSRTAPPSTDTSKSK